MCEQGEKTAPRGSPLLSFRGGRGISPSKPWELGTRSRSEVLNQEVEQPALEKPLLANGSELLSRQDWEAGVLLGSGEG